jgi:hypothetical protein
VSEPGIVSDLAKKAETSGHAQVGNSSIGGSRVIQRWDLVPKKNKGKAALKIGNVGVLTMSPIFLHDVGIENFTSQTPGRCIELQTGNLTCQTFWLRTGCSIGGMSCVDWECRSRCLCWTA